MTSKKFNSINIIHISNKKNFITLKNILDIWSISNILCELIIYFIFIRNLYYYTIMLDYISKNEYNI